MDCEQVREKLIDYTSGDLGHAERADIHGHIDQCYECREQAAEISGLLDACKGVLHHPHPVARFQDLRKRLPCDEAPEHAVAARRQWQRRLLIQRTAVAVAATIALMCSGPFLVRNAGLIIRPPENRHTVQAMVEQWGKSVRFAHAFTEYKVKIDRCFAALYQDAEHPPNPSPGSTPLATSEHA